MIGRGDGWDPSVSADGKHIAFVSFREGAGFQLYVMDVDGKNARKVYDQAGPTGFAYPAWSPDSKSIAWASDVNGGIDLFRVDLDGKNFTQLTKLGGLTCYPAWARDGKSLLFFHTKDASASGMWYIIDSEGKQEPREFLQEERNIEGGRPVWHPK